jgi:outer membrane murein-binding lipoprotein Lpp
MELLQSVPRKTTERRVMEGWIQIVVTLVGVAGSASIWKYMEARLKAKSEAKKDAITNNDGVQYRDDLKNRVRNLEALLAQSSDEKDALREDVLTLTAEVNRLRVEVDYLKKENDRLKDR